jgi:hypothetical protein
MVMAAVFVGPRLRVGLDRPLFADSLRRLAPAPAIAALAIAPLVVSTVALWRSGGYVSQMYLWRSAPAGVDVSTLVLGNPAGWLWRGLPAAAYRAFGIDPIERTAWLGPALVALCAIAVRRRRSTREARLWLVVAAVFGVWALGPRLQAFGHDLHVFLPAVLVRYVPIASNARMPGRAIVVVYLAAAMLAAIGVDALLASGRRRLAVALATLLVLDFLPRGPASYRPDYPDVYRTLAEQRGNGAVVELPIGLRDGFGETGRMDMRILYYQTLHGRPITGGFVARLDPRVIAAYQVHPVLGVLLRLSSGKPLDSQQLLPQTLAGDILRSQNFQFVVLNRRTSPPDLVRYVESGLPLQVLDRDEERTLYAISAPVNAAATRSR